MFITSQNFLNEERSAPIMDRNNDYIIPELTPELISRANSWKSLLPVK